MVAEQTERGVLRPPERRLPRGAAGRIQLPPASHGAAAPEKHVRQDLSLALFLWIRFAGREEGKIVLNTMHK